MESRLKYIAIGIVLIVLCVGAYVPYLIFIGNPATTRELRENPQGERAGKVMLLSLPSGRELPVNYLREGDLVFVGADGSWWDELKGGGNAVEMLIRGETLRGHARAIEDDPDYTLEVFKRLRPTSYKYLNGVLVEVRIGDR
jgi:uncharacterized protein YneF (UPF0154 family)